MGKTPTPPIPPQHTLDLNPELWGIAKPAALRVATETQEHEDAEADVLMVCLKNGFSVDELDAARERFANLVCEVHDEINGVQPSEPPPAPEPESADPINALVAEFNALYMVVSEGGKVMLYKPDTDPILNRRFYQRIDFADFQKMYMNRTVLFGVDRKGDPASSQVGPLWLRHPDRRQFIGGVIFDPSGSNSDPEKLKSVAGLRGEALSRVMGQNEGSHPKRDLRGGRQTFQIRAKLVRQDGAVSCPAGRGRHRHERR